MHATIPRLALALLAACAAACVETRAVRQQPSTDAGDDGADAPLACTAPDDVPARPCTDRAASRCAAGECQACSADADCTHIAGAPRCRGGHCVECTTATEADDCGTKACAAATNECGTVDRGTLGLCGECAADSECASGEAFGGTSRCVSVEFQSAEHGRYCLMDKTTTAGDACPRRYADPIEAVSLNGEEAFYCFPRQALTTCEALADFASAGCTTDADCGDGALDDGLCRDDGAGNQCTYECSSDNDCANGVKCSSAATSYCCTASTGPGCS